MLHGIQALSASARVQVRGVGCTRTTLDKESIGILSCTFSQLYIFEDPQREILLCGSAICSPMETLFVYMRFRERHIYGNNQLE